MVFVIITPANIFFVFELYPPTLTNLNISSIFIINWSLNYMQFSQVRQKFLDYFKSLNHEVVKSSSLIPHNDPTLLFTNAGMNQFKDVFLGLEKRDYTRAVSAQKCVRAGGKHNDLENVGYTARHHTFFEMLGNFSFGDYFKRDAIKYAWGFLTTELKLPIEKLYVTVYQTDDEAYNIWRDEIGLSSDKIIRIGDKASGGSDNFWQMGETGPCGPCTEIFYDHGAHIWGGLPGSADEDGDRFIEIWNCVFMQFNRDESGVLHPLPKPSVDTGMGLERISAVMQHVHGNYEIDLFTQLIQSASTITKCSDSANPSLKVLADHIRSISFLIADGALPSNEGRGYVLRRILRRAIRHGYKLNCRTPFLYQLVATLVALMGDAYPELIVNQEQIEKIIFQEEERFFQTIDNGMQLLQVELNAINSGVERSNSKKKTLAGNIAFKLYDTYGFPLDLTQDVCREHAIEVDIAGFDSCMNEQKNMARRAGKFKMSTNVEYDGCETNFVGYTDTSIEAKIIALYHNDIAVNQLFAGQDGIVVLDNTVFYAESGGQAGDSGILQINGGAQVLMNIHDTQKIRPQVVGHIGNVANGTIQIGDVVIATLDLHCRIASARNHSATHLLHKALHEVIGAHAVQKGSSVTAEYTRFDFANDKSLTSAEIEEIERIVNRVIMHNYPVTVKNMTYDDAIKSGAMALFGEKYTDSVRVVQMGDFSTELCGGTHVSRTGDIGLFSITSETGIANGIRRIEAITGETALAIMQQNLAILDKARDQLKAQSNDIINTKIDGLYQETKLLNKELNELKAKIAGLQAENLLSEVTILANGIKLLVLQLDNLDTKALQELVAKFKDRLMQNSIIVLGGIHADKVNLVVGVTSDLTKQYKAGDLVNKLATLCGGKGGGRPELAQAGGSDVAQLPVALSQVATWL